MNRMDDLISRQSAIKAICEDGTWLESQGCTEITMAERKQRDADILCELPSAERKGKWIRENVVLTSNPPQYQWHCSKCGGMVHGFTTEVLTKYCPNCGSRNKEEEKE